MDTASDEGTTAVKINKLGCIGGLQNQIEELAKGSLSQPVILTDSKGELHRIDGHDIKFAEDGGVVIAESSGRIIQIKKDEACAASAERRRLQEWVDVSDVEWDANASYSVMSATCPMEHTIANSNMWQGSDPTDDSMLVHCYGRWGQGTDWTTSSGQFGTGRYL